MRRRGVDSCRPSHLLHDRVSQMARLSTSMPVKAYASARDGVETADQWRRRAFNVIKHNKRLELYEFSRICQRLSADLVSKAARHLRCNSRFNLAVIV